jgi:site-specific recombinase XerD
VLEAPKNLGHRAILATLYGSGLRVSEVASLKISDLDRENHMIHVRNGKGKKDRRVMLADQLRDVLVAYWRWKKPADWLFPGGKPGCHISRETIFETCRKAARLARIDKRVHPHSFRHAFATHLLDDGVSLPVIRFYSATGTSRPRHAISTLPTSPSAPPEARWRRWERSI